MEGWLQVERKPVAKTGPFSYGKAGGRVVRGRTRFGRESKLQRLINKLCDNEDGLHRLVYVSTGPESSGLHGVWDVEASAILYYSVKRAWDSDVVTTSMYADSELGVEPT